jgi:hypothetical protein
MQQRDTQEKEIRALALQAAATWAVGYGQVNREETDLVLEAAREFEIYIKDGTIPSDFEDDLDIHGPGGTGPGR